MKLKYYVRVEVIIKRWISKSPVSSDLSPPRNSDSNLPFRKGATRMSPGPYIALKLVHFAGNILAQYITVSVDQPTFLFSLLPKSKSSACIYAVQQSFAAMTR